MRLKVANSLYCWLSKNLNYNYCWTIIGCNITWSTKFTRTNNLCKLQEFDELLLFLISHQPDVLQHMIQMTLVKKTGFQDFHLFWKRGLYKYIKSASSKYFVIIIMQQNCKVLNKISKRNIIYNTKIQFTIQY